MKRNYNLYLEDILESINAIDEYIKGLDFESFENTSLVKDAVVWRLAIIGEASTHLSKELKNKIDVPWKRIIAMRNILAHEYFDIDLKVTWKTVTTSIQELKKEIKKYLKS